MTKTTEYGFKPGGYEFFDIESLDIAQWCPTPDGSGLPTQVHLEIRIRGSQTPLVARFKSPDTLGLVIEQLAHYRREVWPDCKSVEIG